MKEYPKFDFEGVSYDFNFYDDSVNLYAVKNALSGIMVSQLIPAANDYVALTGFSDFMAKRASEGDKEIYQLLCLGTLNIERPEIVDTERQIIFDSRNDLSKFLESAKTFMLSWADPDGE